MMDLSTEKMLNTLESIDGTMKRIEQMLSNDNLHGVIKGAVINALVGDKNYNSNPKVNRISVVCFLHKGKKCISVIYRNEDGTERKRRNYIVEHLADENWEVTNQTLHDEEEIFKEPTVI